MSGIVKGKGGAGWAAGVLGALTLAMAAPVYAQSEKTVTIVLPEEPAHLDGCDANRSATGRIIRQNVVESLTQINPDDGSLIPALAMSWEKVDDKTWRFKLRQGVKFHDGAPFNAETATRAISRTMDTKLECGTRTKSFGNLKIRGLPVDEFTLDVTADKPAPILPTQMGEVTLVSPNTSVERLALTPVGTGAYKFEKWAPGQEIVVVRNPEWWGKPSNIDKARYVFRGESAVRAAMVKIGEADFAPNIGPADAVEPNMDASYLNAETTFLRIEMGRKPFDDIRVRMALNLAFDRYAIPGAILPKDVVKATQIVGPLVPGHNLDIDKKLWPHDAKRAAQLVAEAKAAGTPVGERVWMIGRSNHYPGVQELLEAAMGMFNAAGLNVELRMVEQAQGLQFQNKPYSAERPPLLYASQHDNNNGDAVFSMFTNMSCDGLQSFICDPSIDTLISKATVLPLGPERVKAWQEVQRIVYEDLVAHVWLFHMVGYSRVGPRIDFRPSISTNSEIQVSQMRLK